MEATALRSPIQTVHSISSDLALEQARLAALYSYDVLDQEPERAFDDFARMAAQICGVSSASISLLDHSRIWRVATAGLTPLEASAVDAFSTNVLRRAPRRVLISDAQHHPDWRTSSLWSAQEGYAIRFYACAALVTADGHCLGAIEVMSVDRTDLADAQIDSLRALAGTVMEKLEIRRALRSLYAMHRFHEKEKRASNGAALAVDLKAPLTSLLAFHDLLKRLEASNVQGNDDAEDVAELVGRSARELAVVAAKVPAILQPAHAAETATCVNVPELVAETLGLLIKPTAATISTDFSVRIIHARRDALQQILLNLCSNALRFVAKPGGRVRISLSENSTSYLLYVNDNGPGIPEPRLSQVFAMLYDDDGADASPAVPHRGIALVRWLAATMGGNVVVDSTEGVGTTFCVSLPKETK
jgi:signal transduction histidine kinase